MSRLAFERITRGKHTSTSEADLFELAQECVNNNEETVINADYLVIADRGYADAIRLEVWYCDTPLPCDLLSRLQAFGISNMDVINAGPFGSAVGQEALTFRVWKETE